MDNIKKLIYTILIISVITLIAMIFINGTFLTKTYLEPWNKNYHTQFEDKRIQVVSHGLLAPNAHNKQSWKIVLDKNNPNKFDLFLDETRLLPETDPNHRQTIMSHGTFLELIDISAKKLGLKADIEIFPHGEINIAGTLVSIREKPVATITLNKSETKNSNLYDAIYDRVTTRTPYLDKPLTEEQINQIKILNNYEGIDVVIFQNSADLELIKEIALKGIEIESTNIATLNETHEVFRVNEYKKNKYRDGVTFSALGFSPIKKYLMEGVSTLFPVSLEVEGKIWLDGAKERIPKTPAYIMILSQKDDRTTHIKIGMLYARIQLAGTAFGLSMQPTMQVTQEYPKMAELYNQINDEFTEIGQKVQMLFRVGEAEKKVEHAPRRDVMDLIQ